MYALQDLLASRTWYELRATAKAHGLKFNGHHTRSQAKARLYTDLIEQGQLKHAFRDLAPVHREALQVLQAGEGQMRLSSFLSIYGDIRAYRPWRPDTPRYPWKRPISTAEKLWYLGFIQIVEGEKGKPDCIVAPHEVMCLLPGLPRPTPVHCVLPPADFTRYTLCVDITILLGFLLGNDVHLSWGRWFAPHVLQAVNSRLFCKEDLDGVKSELQTGRIRFLHYLADAAGLVSLQNGFLKPTVAAWQWLESLPQEQWLAVWSAWERDMQRPNEKRLWATYRFPAVPFKVWKTVCNQLEDIGNDGKSYKIGEFVTTLKPYAPGENLEKVDYLLKCPFHWSGLVTINGGHFSHQSPNHLKPQNAELAIEPGRLWIGLPQFPRLRPLCEVFSWANVDETGLWVDNEVVKRATGLGYDAVQIGSVLMMLCGKPIAPDAQERLRHWERQVNQLKVQHMVVITSPDSQLLAGIRADRHLRQMVKQALSPHCLAVYPHQVDKLCKRLKRRGISVTLQTPAPQSTEPFDGLTPEMVEYLWLAVRVYQRTGRLSPQEVRVPGAILDWLSNQLSLSQVDFLEQISAKLLDDFVQTMEGKSTWTGSISQDNPQEIRKAIELAFETQGSITIEYFSPGRGEAVKRSIEPILPIVEHNGAEYVEAWCHLADDTRTFRIDRIVKIID